MATSTREAYGTPKRCVTRDMNKTRRRRFVRTYRAFPSCENGPSPTSMVVGREHVRRDWSRFVDEFFPLIVGTWRFAVSGIAIVCRSMLRNNLSREIVSRVASVLAALGQPRGILDEYDSSRVRATLYRLHAPAALLLTVLACPPVIDLAAVPLAVFAGFTILGTRDLIQTRHAVLRNYPISAHCVSCSNRYDPRCVSISSKTRRTAGRSAATSRRWPISAPRWRWTSVRSGRSTTSMQRDSSGSAIRSCRGRSQPRRSASVLADRIARGPMMHRYSISRP